VKKGLALVAHHSQNLASEYLGIEGHQNSRRGIMGDKGGKKDKEKGQKQKNEKQVAKAKDKQEKHPNKKV
jgi:hypothetical protein